MPTNGCSGFFILFLIYFCFILYWCIFELKLLLHLLHASRLITHFFASSQQNVLDLLGRMSCVSCRRTIVPSWIFCGSNIFSRGYFVAPKFFFVGILWLRNFFSWVFRRSEIFLWLFCGSKFFFLVLISWFKDFRLLAAWERVTENRNA